MLTPVDHSSSSMRRAWLRVVKMKDIKIGCSGLKHITRLYKIGALNEGAVWNHLVFNLHH